MPKLPKYSAPALEKGLEILEFLADKRQPCTQQEIAKALGRSANELYRMLHCLVERGYLFREEETGAFRATLKLFQLGHQTDAVSRLRTAAIPPMEELADSIGQACHLSVRHGNSILHLIERMPPQRICVAVGEGSRLPFSQTSSGKVLLSRMPEAGALEYLKADPHFQSLGRQRRSLYLRQLEGIRERGYLATPSELTPHVQDIAVPVGVPGTDTAAILAVAQVVDPKSAAYTASIRAVRTAATQIDRNLGLGA